MTTLRIGIVTCSDRAFRGDYEDEGGPALIDWLDDAIASEWEPVERLVPDEQGRIAQTLRELTTEPSCDLVFTTGGTGPTERDVTPEATREVADKIMPGFGERMRQISLQYVPTAILSRQVGAVRNNTLIVNLPGNPSAIGEILDELFEVIPATVDLLDGPDIEVADGVDVFYPGHD